MSRRGPNFKESLRPDATEEEAPLERIEEGEGTPVDRPRGRRAFSWQRLAADEEAAAARAAGASPSRMVNFDVNPVRARGVTMAPLPPRSSLPACLARGPMPAVEAVGRQGDPAPHRPRPCAGLGQTSWAALCIWPCSDIITPRRVCAAARLQAARVACASRASCRANAGLRCAMSCVPASVPPCRRPTSQSSCGYASTTRSRARSRKRWGF